MLLAPSFSLNNIDMISEYKMAEGGSPTLPPNPPGPILHPDIIPDIIPVDLGWITGIFFNLAFF